MQRIGVESHGSNLVRLAKAGGGSNRINNNNHCHLRQANNEICACMNKLQASAYLQGSLLVYTNSKSNMVKIEKGRKDTEKSTARVYVPTVHSTLESWGWLQYPYSRSVGRR